MTGSAGGRPLPALHLVTDDEVLARADFPGLARDLLRAGGGAVALHLRGPGTPGGVLERLGRRLRPPSEAPLPGWLVVNDRVDVARAVGADGVQLGRRSLAVADARRVAGPLALGASVHGPHEARSAAGADWWILGTVWATPSHPGRPGVGPEGIRTVVELGGPPVVAIGGVTPDRVAAARAAGAAGVAVLRGVWAARDPLSALDGYLTAWSDA